MEFQIVSPERSSDFNPSNFTKFIDEELVIPAGSSIHMNSCILRIPSGVLLTSDQVVALSIDDEDTFGGITGLLVEQIESDGSPQNNRLLFESVHSGISACISESNINSSYTANQTLEEGLPDRLGLLSNPIYVSVEQDDYNNNGCSVGMTYDATQKIIYQSAVSNAETNSFFLNPVKYFQGTKISTYLTETTDPFGEDFPNVHWNLFNHDTGNLLNINDVKNIIGTSAQFCIGFYGNQFGNDDSVGTGARTSQTSIVNVPTSGGFNIPTSFACLFLEYDGTDVWASFHVASNPSIGEISDWDKQQYSIDTMTQVSRVNLEDFMTIDQPLIFKGVVYGYPDASNLFVNFGVSIHGDTTPLFESSPVDERFFNGLGYSTTTIKRSQILNSFCSFNVQNIGCKLYTDSIAQDQAIVNRYQLVVGSQLGPFFNNYSGEEPTILDTRYPTAIEGDAGDVETNNIWYRWDIKDILSTRSYAIRLNNFPINVMKTNQTIEHKGYMQPILGVVPAPFEEDEVDLNLDNYTGYNIRKYEPLFIQSKKLKNQDFIVNRFDIQVVDLYTDKEAPEINRLCVNFTIVSPEKK